MKHVLALLIGMTAAGIIWAVVLIFGPQLIYFTILSLLAMFIMYGVGQMILALWELWKPKGW
jgi:hypothetical protein